MTTETLRFGSSGFTIDAQLLFDGVPADISGATLLEIRFEKQDGSTVHLPAALGSTGLDGVVVYLVQPGDLDQAGSWRFQFEVATPSWRRFTTPVAFEVGPNIP